MKQHTNTCFSIFKSNMHVYFIFLCIYSTNIYCMMLSKNRSKDASKKQHHSKKNLGNQQHK